MKNRTWIGLIALIGLLPAQWAGAGIVSVGTYANDAAFSAATGAVSLTGPLPDIGNQGTSVTLGDATLSAANSIFVGTGWSTLLPNARAIAISGPENLLVSLDTGAATAFGFYFHEPTGTAQLDGCNTTCVDSTFQVEFLLGASVVDSFLFNAGDNQSIFLGAILDEAFDAVRFTETVGGADNEFYGEMFVARVPEPGMLGLLGAGLIGLGAMRRKARA